MNKKGKFLKTILTHNIVFMDCLFLLALVLLWSQGHSPNGLIKCTVAFYGGEGILGMGIKVFKILTESKSKKSEKKSEESEEEV